MIPVRWLCFWASMTVSSWYYSSTDGRRGCKPSRYTYTYAGDRVGNTEIISRIKDLLRMECVCYGYEKITSHLRDEGFLINKKKVYRLIREAHLLHAYTRIRTIAEEILSR